MFDDQAIGTGDEEPMQPDVGPTTHYQLPAQRQAPGAFLPFSGGGMITRYMPGDFQQSPLRQTPGTSWGTSGLLAGRHVLVTDKAVSPFTQTQLAGRDPQNSRESMRQSLDRFTPSLTGESSQNAWSTHPFAEAYRNHIDQNGDPVEGLAQRKQRALDNGENLEGYDLSRFLKVRNNTPDADEEAQHPRFQPELAQLGTPQNVSDWTSGGQTTAEAMPSPLARGMSKRPSIGDRDADHGSMADKTVGFTEDKTEQVTGRNWRHLTEEEKNTMGYFYPRELLDDIKLHVGERAWFQPKGNAMTLQDDVYWFDGNQPDMYDKGDRNILAHEIQHANQYRHGMTQGGYVLESAKQTLRHWSFADGYEKNKYEDDARNVASGKPSTITPKPW